MALATRQPTWQLGFADEVWWSRIARPALSSWSPTGQPLRLVEQTVPADDPHPKALACYGLWLPDAEDLWLRFVDRRPISGVTTQFLGWCADRLAQAGKTALFLIWDQASWHISKVVRQWIGMHNRQVKASGEGVRIIHFELPSKSPWLNPIEAKWLHGKRRVIEPDRVLSAHELEKRVYAAFTCQPEPHLTNAENVP
jgi:transposase